MSKANKVIDGIEYVVASSACEMLEVSLSTLKKMRYENKIGYYQLNERCILYKLTDIDQIKRQRHVPMKENANVVVETSDGNVIFQGKVYINELTVASKLRITLEKVKSIANVRSIMGPKGIRFYHTDDVNRLFVEGSRKVDPNKKLLRG